MSTQRARQPQVPARIDPGSGLRPEFVLLGGQQVELASGRPWTDAGAARTFAPTGVGLNPNGTANVLTRAGGTTTAQTKCTFVLVFTRTAANAFAEICGMSSNGTGFNIGYDGGGVSFGIRKGGVFDLTTITPLTHPVAAICSHDQATGDYWMLTRELIGNTVSRVTQTNTSASSASNGTFSINRNGGANTFGGSIFLAVGAYQYFPEAWGRRYLTNPWALFQPLPARRRAPQVAAAVTAKPWHYYAQQHAQMGH